MVATFTPPNPPESEGVFGGRYRRFTPPAIQQVAPLQTFVRPSGQRVAAPLAQLTEHVVGSAQTTRQGLVPPQAMVQAPEQVKLHEPAVLHPTLL